MLQTPHSANLVVLGFKSLADPLRLEIMERLRHQELCVCDLCAQMGVAQSKLSFHLKALKTAELVCTRQEGRWIYYRLNLPQLVALEQYLAEFRRCSPMRPARPCPPQDGGNPFPQPAPWPAASGDRPRARGDEEPPSSSSP